MKIGIIVYSQTGNTYAVALRLKEKLSAAGHAVDLERLQILGEYRQGDQNIQFESLPDLGSYETLVFGAPVQAFSLAPVMKSYLKQLASLQGKQVACLITKQLPFRWTGGNQAVNQMKNICASKGGVVCGSAIVVWSSKRREAQIIEAVDTLSQLF